jgi:hypothetical protein
MKPRNLIRVREEAVRQLTEDLRTSGKVAVAVVRRQGTNVKGSHSPRPQSTSGVANGKRAALGVMPWRVFGARPHQLRVRGSQPRLAT